MGMRELARRRVCVWPLETKIIVATSICYFLSNRAVCSDAAPGTPLWFPRIATLGSRPRLVSSVSSVN